jgi:hypothetical protein
VIAASGLKYVGVGTTALGWILCVALLSGGASWLILKRPWRRLKVPGELPPATEEPALLRTDAPEIEQV